MNTAELRKSIVDLLDQRGQRVLAVRDIARKLTESGLKVDREKLGALIEQMEGAGEIIAVRGKRYSLPRHTSFVIGTYRARSDGSGLVVPVSRDDAARQLFVGRRSDHNAMNGDLVVARASASKKSQRTARGEVTRGEIVRVLRREHSSVVGRFHEGSPAWVRPYDTRLDIDIEIEPGHEDGAEHGQIVEVDITRYPDRHPTAEGRIIDVLGFIWEPGVDVEIVLRKYRIPREFPEEVEREAEAVPLEVADSEIADRTDLRDRVIVTIDGETARDFDDAVEVTRLPSGNFRLGVHIADVSQYVRPGSALDAEAWTRGTSVYFSGRVVPMLPERLSNGICSLNPRVDRLVFSVEMEIDQNGGVVARKFFRAIIRTRARLTYTEVAATIAGDSDAIADPVVVDLVRVMDELYRVLRARRDRRGSIDFDLPQHEVLLTEQGEISSIRALERNDAHRLIEEFMLATNETVAKELFFAGQPSLYRNHLAPEMEKLEELKMLLAEFGYELKGDLEKIRPGDLQRVLQRIDGDAGERFLNEVILRSMKRAVYAPECNGHFALAFEQYTHFTSPIRRYPDLVVHRMLGAHLKKGGATADQEQLERDLVATGEQSSTTERRAEAAEREVMEWKKVVFMLDKVGEKFNGVITGVVPFGLFVELDEFFLQGLVPIASIGGDYWSYLDREHRLRGSSTEREFRLGDRVVVEVARVDEDRIQIDLRLIEAGGRPVKARTSQEYRQKR
ncbi:MAG: ribonuclease R [Acidobacteria bacterium]|nr:ribonuclease R [Acidobacteriota bacterium]